MTGFGEAQQSQDEPVGRGRRSSHNQQSPPQAQPAGERGLRRSSSRRLTGWSASTIRRGAVQLNLRVSTHHSSADAYQIDAEVLGRLPAGSCLTRISTRQRRWRRCRSPEIVKALLSLPGVVAERQASSDGAEREQWPRNRAGRHRASPRRASAEMRGREKARPWRADLRLSNMRPSSPSTWMAGRSNSAPEGFRELTETG